MRVAVPTAFFCIDESRVGDSLGSEIDLYGERDRARRRDSRGACDVTVAPSSDSVWTERRGDVTS
ncbi:MAG TPA: hypothetical protein VFZ73_20190 [Gemmatimonadaceae bacterium]